VSRIGLLSRAFVFWALALAAATSACAQVEVNVSLRRALYLVYEPLILTVSIRNLTGAELVLADTPRNRWFSIQVERAGGTPVQPNDPNFKNEPLQIAPGQTVRRTVNLTPLFPLGEFGSYRVRAVVRVESLNRFFSSPPLAFEITDGRVLWQQTVGVPPGSGLPGRTRSYSLLAHRLPASTMLYLRVEDPDRGVIYCTTQLGRYLATGTPGVLIDHGNEIHILHAMAPKEYLYSHFGLDGKVRTQQAYRDWGSRPALAPTDDGGVRVVGGTPYDPKATPPEEKLPGLGEHPVPIPKSAPTPTPKKEDRPPENLLSR